MTINSGSTASPNSTSPSSPSQTSQPNSQAGSQHDRRLGTGVIVAIVISVIVALLLLALFVLFWRRKSKLSHGKGLAAVRNNHGGPAVHLGGMAEAADNKSSQGSEVPPPYGAVDTTKPLQPNSDAARTSPTYCTGMEGFMSRDTTGLT